jgi:hypothetical protein
LRNDNQNQDSSDVWVETNEYEINMPDGIYPPDSQ